MLEGDGKEEVVTVNTDDYIDPIIDPPFEDVKELLLKVEVSIASLKSSEVQIDMSPYRIQVSGNESDVVAQG